MPLPFLVGVVATTVPTIAEIITGAVAAGTAGLCIHGAKKMKDAKDTSKSATRRHDTNVNRYHKSNDAATKALDTLGELELNILKDFEAFADMIEKIQNYPEFTEYDKNGVTLPKLDLEAIRVAAGGAGVVLEGLGGAAAGTAAGIAVSGAVDSILMSGGASLAGMTVSSLTAEGALSVGALGLGGGVATSAGAALLNGIAPLVGGAVFNAVGTKMSDKADEAWRQMKEAEKKINEACEYLDDLTKMAKKHIANLKKGKRFYDEWFPPLNRLVTVEGKTKFRKFKDSERKDMENLIRLVKILYWMCQVKLVLKPSADDEMPQINYEGVRQAEQGLEQLLKEVA
jgi:hypothetical protein